MERASIKYVLRELAGGCVDDIFIGKHTGITTNSPYNYNYKHDLYTAIKVVCNIYQDNQKVESDETVQHC